MPGSTPFATLIVLMLAWAKQRSERVLFLEAQECSGGRAGDGYRFGSRMQSCESCWGWLVRLAVVLKVARGSALA